MLAGWKSEGLGCMGESESEDEAVRRDLLFGGERGFRPGASIQEGWAGFGGVDIEGWFGKLDARGSIKGADVVLWHHCFGCFAVCGQKQLAIALGRGWIENVRIAMNSSLASRPAALRML